MMAKDFEAELSHLEFQAFQEITAAPLGEQLALLEQKITTGELRDDSPHAVEIRQRVAEALANPLTSPQIAVLEWLLQHKGKRVAGEQRPAVHPAPVEPPIHTVNIPPPPTPVEIGAVVRPDWAKVKPRKHMPRTENTIPQDTPLRAFGKVMGLALGAMAFIALAVGIYRGGDQIVQSLKSLSAPASKSRTHFVATADRRPVPVFPTPAAARLGTGLTPQSEKLVAGERYRVVKSEGDVIMVEGAIRADGKMYGLWVDRRYVVDVE